MQENELTLNFHEILYIYDLVCPFLFSLVKMSYLSTACMNIMSISIIDVNIIVLTHYTIDTLETKGEYYSMEIIFFYSDCLLFLLYVQFYRVNYYLKWVRTSWTYNIL